MLPLSTCCPCLATLQAQLGSPPSQLHGPCALRASVVAPCAWLSTHAAWWPSSHACKASPCAQLGEFGGDNRAGIDRTLHRISCLRNRDGRVIGLTCRAGRAVCGSAALAADIVAQGRSLLLLVSDQYWL